jgi:5-hydroxyisourate hydrolase
MNGITTHILDLTHGTPAKNVKVSLFFLEHGLETKKRLLQTTTTNQNGRVDQPLLKQDEMMPGEYELLFYIGDYFREKGLKLEEPMFLDKVVVRFGISQPNSHYHIPLLISPWGYQVYRGS